MKQAFHKNCKLAKLVVNLVNNESLYVSTIINCQVVVWHHSFDGQNNRAIDSKETTEFYLKKKKRNPKRICWRQKRKKREIAKNILSLASMK
jgi:hypothetical protein